LAFGERVLLDKLLPYTKLRKRYPWAHIVICSTAGQVSNSQLSYDTIVATAISFERSTVRVAEIDFLESNNMNKLGEVLQTEILKEDLKSILVLSEDSLIDSAELIKELDKQTKSKINVFGGFAGDELNFERTIVGINKDASPGKIAIIGFYGEKIHFGYGCDGGWSDFGPERIVTKSDNKVLFRIGDRPALDLYKEYLGKYANDLPSSALYFPLSIKESKHAVPVVRTPLLINETDKSITFSGDIPQDSKVRFMKGNFDKLINACYTATAKACAAHIQKPQLAIMVSCVGRGVVLGNRLEEEFEVVKELCGDETVVCGFYSYGEISPVENKACELHSQTMTIATITED